MQKIYDVFISYRRKEKNGTNQGTQIARALFTYLESKGLRVFLDEKRMDNGPFPEQLQWQVTHAPNYVFIATEAAMKFRNAIPPDTDYVAEEVRLALKLYDSHPKDRVILPVIPYNVKVPDESDDSFPQEIHRLFMHNAPHPLSGDTPSDDNLKDIYARLTKVNRGNLWNAGSRWLEEMTAEGHRFAGLDIDRRIMPLAGKKQEEGIRLPIRAHAEEKSDMPLMEMIKDTPGHLFLIGEGGIGKTTALLSIMQEVYASDRDEPAIERMRLDSQVPLFVELSRAPDTYGRLYEGGRSTFIQRAIYQQIRQDLKVKQVSSAAVEEINEAFNLDPDTAVKPIHDLFTQREGAPEYLLLLDGLNEVSRTEIGYKTKDGDGTELIGKSTVVSMVLQEIRMLMEDCPNVRVILTSRSKEETSWCDRATLLYLSGMREDLIESYLRSRNLPEKRIKAVKQNEKLQNILRIPLFLTLYASLEGNDEILTQGEILYMFFHQKKEALYTIKARNEKIDENVDKAASAKQPNRLTAQMQSFILDFILPEIAWQMVKNGKFYLRMREKGNQEGLRKIIERVLTDEGDIAVCGENGIDAFTEYLHGFGKSNTKKIAEEMCFRLGNGSSNAWTDIIAGILDCTIMTLGILQQNDTSGQTEYGFIHHYFRDYFAAVHQINHLRLAVFLQEYEENDLARECLHDWKQYPLPFSIQRYIGEALGEAHNPPVCDEHGNWHYAVPAYPCMQNLIKRAFEIYRDHAEGQDGYSIWNLLEILKNVRRDLSGEMLSGLDLQGCSINGVPLGRRLCAADTDHSILSDHFFFSDSHLHPVTGIAYSHDGKRILTASNDGTVKIWDADTMQITGTITGHRGCVSSAEFSHKDQMIVTASWDKTVKLWDGKTLEIIHAFIGHSSIVSSASFSQNDELVVTASYDGSVRIWNTRTGQEEAVYQDDRNRVFKAQFSPDDEKIIIASEDSTIKIIDRKSMMVRKILRGHFGWVNSVQYDKTGEMFVSASLDFTVKIWNSDDYHLIGSLDGHTDDVVSASFNSDRDRILTVSRDGTIRIWNTETLQEIGRISEKDHVLNCAIFSPCGNFIAYASGCDIIIRDAYTLNRTGFIKGQSNHICFAAYNPDQSQIAFATGDGTVQLFDAHEMRKTGALKGHDAWVHSAEYSKDGRKIITASYDKTIKIWDSRSLVIEGELKGHENDVINAFFSCDSRRAISTSWDGTVRIWDVEQYCETGRLSGYSDLISYAVFSPCGKYIATASWNKTAQIWDAGSLNTIRVLEGHTGRLNTVKYSHSGDRIVTSSTDHTAIIWNAVTFEKLHVLQGHDEEISDASFSSDGQFVVTASYDRTAKIWNALSGEETGTLSGHTDTVFTASFSADCQRVLTAAADNTVKIWDSKSLRCIHTIKYISGLDIVGVSLKHIHSKSNISDAAKRILYEYGADFDPDEKNV